MTVIVALIIFMVVICLHELGHFLLAKKVDIKVNEFSIGMGPALTQTQKGETTYSLRAIPIGGYCAMEGEDEDNEEEPGQEGEVDPRSFDGAKPGQRFLTILAGPVMNLIIAFVCFFLYLGLMGMPVPVVDGFSDNSPLEAAGLQVGDEIVAIDGKMVENYDHMIDLVQAGHGEEMTLDYLRGDETRQVKIKPEYIDGRYYVGMLAGRRTNWPASFLAAGGMVGQLYVQLFKVLGGLFSGAISTDSVSGPVGVISLIGQAANQGLGPVLFLTGYISLNLAFFNLLPIPALDGSKLLLIAIEKLRGRAIQKKTEVKITLAGFAFLIGLILLVSIKDIARLIH